MTTDPKREVLCMLGKFNLRIELESARTWADGYDPLKPKSPIARVNPNFLVALIEHAISTLQPPEGEGRAEVLTVDEVKRLADDLVRAESAMGRALGTPEAGNVLRARDAARKALYAAIDSISKHSEDSGQPLARRIVPPDLQESVWSEVRDWQWGDGSISERIGLTQRISNSILAAPSAGHGEGWVSVQDRLPPACHEVIALGRPYGTKKQVIRCEFVTYISTRPRECVEDEEITHWKFPTPKDNRHE